MSIFVTMGKLIINNEECREVIDFERYSVSESGRVYRTETGRKRSWRTKGKVYINESKIHFRIHNGALRQGQVSLTDINGKLHNLSISIVVARAFDIITDDYNKKKQAIAYKDGNKKNIHYTNLHIVEKIHSFSKLKKNDVAHIRKQIKNGIPLRTIGKLFNVSEMQINRIKTGENWGNGKRKIKAPVAPFEIKDGKIRKYIATFNRENTRISIRKKFYVKRNSKMPTDNLIVGIINGYKLTKKHSNITRALELSEKLNSYFFK